MGETAKGYPYPEPDEAIAGGAAKIRDLAEAIDTRIRGGLATITTANNTASGTVVVTFPAGLYATPPRVVAVSRNGNWWAFLAAAPTVAAVTVGVASYIARGSATVTAEWHAVPA